MYTFVRFTGAWYINKNKLKQHTQGEAVRNFLIENFETVFEHVKKKRESWKIIVLKDRYLWGI